MAPPENNPSDSKPLIKYIFFLIVFIVSFCFIKIKSIEIFGLGLFFAINILFCIFIGKELSNQSYTDNSTTERLLRYGSLITAVAFSFVSTIMMIMTFVTLQSKFAANHSEIMWSPSDRRKLDTIEILFITATTFIGVTTLYVFNSAEDVHKMSYNIFNTALNGSAANWLRVLFPIAIIGVGSALYGRLQMSPLEVNKTPTNVTCDPQTNLALRPFKDAFIKTYWFLFAFVIVVLARPFIEANFNIFGAVIHPSSIFGFQKDDRSIIFGQNPKTGSFVRWDVIYLLAKYAFGLAGLIYAAFSIKYFSEIPPDNACLYTSTHIRQLYIAFIFFLIVFYTFNTLSASTLTNLTTGIMRYFVPPALFGTSYYLILITNYFVHVAPKLIIQ